MRSVSVIGLAMMVTAGTLAAQQIAPVHVLNIASGPAGTETNGVFRLTDERSVFSRATDREVIVFFQWEHLPGPHKLVAQWRSADGGATASSAIATTPWTSASAHAGTFRSRPAWRSASGRSK